MINLQQILAAINLKLANKFGIDINSNDIKEGFKRPSFFVQFENILKTDYLYHTDRQLTVRIYYFPTNKHQYQLEVLEKQEEIEELFRLGVAVGDRYIDVVDGIEADITDGVLMVSFDLSYSYKVEEIDTSEKMGDLYVGN